jgi:hypothetical protein
MSGTRSISVSEFSIWRPGYAGATVEILVGGTTTRASVFSDPTLTTPAANPQTLISRTEGGVGLGRFAAPVYVGVPYQLAIGSDGQTGVARLPLYDLSGANASTATVLSQRSGAVARALRDRANDTIQVADFGALGATAAANNAILVAAIGIAGADGGGDVILPAGSFPFTSLTLPANVRLVGQGRGVTTLRSLEASTVLTLGGAGAGMRDMTLDGVSLLSGSIGVLGIGRNEVVFENVEIKRFDTGLLMRGGTNLRARDFIISNCNRGGRLRGDLNASGAGGGAALRDLDWLGGAVTANLTTGLELVYLDAAVEGAGIKNVLFDSNTGDAVLLTGARSTMFSSCRWVSNTTNMRVADVAGDSAGTVRSLTVQGGSFTSGEMRWDGRCEAVVYQGCTFSGASLIASVPQNAIALRDCTEDSSTASTGAVERIMRSNSRRGGLFTAQTTDATATAIWQFDLAPGEVARIRARVVGRQANGVNTASYGLEGVVTRAGATMTFGSASSTLAAGATVTGSTSGATAIVQAVSGTTSGTITLRSITGTFQSGEGLTFSGGQTATATGSLVTSNAALAGVTATGFTHETDAAWDSTIDASGSQARVTVTGKASMTITWDAQVELHLGGVN